jgi:ComF family protein
MCAYDIMKHIVIIQYFMHRVRACSHLVFKTLRFVTPLTKDEQLARAVESSHVHIRQIRKGGSPITIAMPMNEPAVRALIHTLKYHGSVESVERIASLLAAHVRTICTKEHIDYIVPVPLSAQRLRERGFNQVTFACEHIAHKEPSLGALLFPTLLKRTRNTLPQTNLGRAERISNVSGAFICEADITGKRILLVDDVVTTGATLLSAKRSLIHAGASAVHVFAFAGR